MKKSSRMSPELVRQIKELLRSGLYYQHQIAAMLGINQGRVSEVKHGLYG
jgi:predicted XRE-type DNA-binding protein